MKLVGLRQKDIEEAKKKGVRKTYGLTFLAALITAWILANIIDFTQSDTIPEGISSGFYTWLGFVATTHLVHTLFERRPIKLYYIIAGHHLVEFCVMGGILAIWT